jgi:hypothetical protein
MCEVYKLIPFVTYSTLWRLVDVHMGTEAQGQTRKLMCTVIFLAYINEILGHAQNVVWIELLCLSIITSFNGRELSTAQRK